MLNDVLIDLWQSSNRILTVRKRTSSTPSCSVMTLHTHIKLVKHLIPMVIRYINPYLLVTENILNKFEIALKPFGIPIQYSKIPTISNGTPEAAPSQSPPDSSTPPPDLPSTDLQPPPSPRQSIFYIGSESLGLTNLLMTNAHSNVSRLTPAPAKSHQNYYILRYIHTTHKRTRPVSNPHARTNSSCDATPSYKKHETPTYLEYWSAPSALVRVPCFPCIQYTEVDRKLR
jgi:hypothetical protein